MVLVVTWAGYPGVVCVTPMAWLIALRVGLLCATQSPSSSTNRRVTEAAIAGGWLGLLQGALFWLFLPRIGPVQPSEQLSATIIGFLMTTGGILTGALLATITALLVERRRSAMSDLGP